MNDKVRFIVLTGLAIAALPLTLAILFAAWLTGEVWELAIDYVKLYRKAWPSAQGRVGGAR